MAVQQLPTGLEPIIEGFEKLAGAATRTIFDDELRQREIQNDPSLMIQLATMARAAAKEDALPELAQSLRLEEGFLTQLSDAFVPSSEERFETAFLESGGPELLAETQILQSMLSGQEAGAAIESALPFREADARLKGIEAEIAENEFTSEVFQLRVREGIPEMTVNLEAATARLEANNIRLQESTLSQYRDMLEDDSLSPHMRQMATLSLVNPNLASHIQFHENMDFQMSLRKLMGSGGQNPADQLGVYLKLRTARNDAIDRAREAEETGEGDELKIARNDIENLNELAEDLTNAGLIPPLPGVSARVTTNFFGNPKNVELLESIPMSDRVRKVFQNFEDAEELGEPVTTEDIERAKESFEGVFSPMEMNQLEAGLSMIEAHLQPVGEEMRTEISREGPLGARSRPDFETKLDVLLENLSIPMKAFLAREGFQMSGAQEFTGR